MKKVNSSVWKKFDNCLVPRSMPLEISVQYSSGKIFGRYNFRPMDLSENFTVQSFFESMYLYFQTHNKYKSSNNEEYPQNMDGCIGRHSL